MAIDQETYLGDVGPGLASLYHARHLRRTDESKSLEIDLFIFSCEGIDSHGGLWDSNMVNASFKSLLLKYASQSLLLVDKSKFNRSGEARFGHLDEVTHIVSDTKLFNIGS